MVGGQVGAVVISGVNFDSGLAPLHAGGRLAPAGGTATVATGWGIPVLAQRVRCPVLVISAPNDKITAHTDAKALATATDGELVSIAGGGHNPQARKPVAVNLALRDSIRASAFTADSRQVRGATTAG